jgi:hypothetical protein
MRRRPSLIGADPAAIPGLILALLLCGGGSARAQRPSWIPEPVPQPSVNAEWIPAPGEWEPVDRAAILDAEGKQWWIAIDRRVIGGLRNREVDVPVYSSRAVFARVRSRDTIAVAVMIPTGNATVKIVAPGDPAIDAVPSRATEDTWGRWPEPCALSLLSAGGNLDLDADGRIEIAISRMCGCAPVACSGVVFVSLGGDRAAVLDPSDLVHDADLGPLFVQQMIAAGDSSRPVLLVEPEILDACRFIALAGIRGRNECRSCCLFPVLLRPTFGGEYETTYDGKRQGEWKKRIDRDLSYVAAGDAREPASSDEQVRVAQAAAFLYMTGSAGQARDAIVVALGDRARDYRIQEVLSRLERIFRRMDPGTGSGDTGRMPRDDVRR